jgi:cytochrome P450
MFDISLRLFFLDVKPDESKFLNKLFTDSISSATSLLRWPLPFTKLKKGIEAREYLLDYFQEKAKLVNEDTDKTLFAELVRTNKGDAGLSDFEIAEHMIFLLLAAHDTTTITLTNSLYYLSQDEDYRNNVLNESFSVDHTDISSLKNGNFAEAMFKEAMRIYPPVPFSIRYVVDDIVVNGATLKGGTYTTISPLLLHHDERYWSNPSIFDPLRFIDPSYHNDAYFPFAGGAHTCLGKFFASYMYKNVVYKFVQSFNDYTINEKLEIRPTPIPHPLEDVRVSI